MTKNRVTPLCVVPRSAPFIRSVATLPVDTLVSAEKDSKVQTNPICIMSVDIIESDKQNDNFVFDAVSTVFRPYAYKILDMIFARRYFKYISL